MSQQIQKIVNNNEEIWSTKVEEGQEPKNSMKKVPYYQYFELKGYSQAFLELLAKEYKTRTEEIAERRSKRQSIGPEISTSKEEEGSTISCTSSVLREMELLNLMDTDSEFNSESDEDYKKLTDEEFIELLKEQYKVDPWCTETEFNTLKNTQKSECDEFAHLRVLFFWY